MFENNRSHVTVHEKFFRRLCHTPGSPALSCFVHEAIMNSANAQYSGEHFLVDESSGGA